MAAETSSSSRDGQPGTLLDDGDVGPEAPVHLGELQRDVAAADDDQMLGHGVEFQDADVGQVVDVGQSRDVGHDGPAADVEEDALGLDDPAIDRERVRSVKRACPRIKVHPSMPSSQPSTPSRSSWTMPSLRALTFAMSTVTADGADPEIGRPARDVGRVRTGDQSLGRDAAIVDARSADQFAFDDCDGLTRRRQPAGQWRAGLAGTHDDGVVALRHGRQSVTGRAVSAAIAKPPSTATTSSVSATGRSMPSLSESLRRSVISAQRAQHGADQARRPDRRRVAPGRRERRPGEATGDQAGDELHRDQAARGLRQLIGDQFADRQHGQHRDGDRMPQPLHPRPVEVDPVQHGAPTPPRRARSGPAARQPLRSAGRAAERGSASQWDANTAAADLRGIRNGRT